MEETIAAIATAYGEGGIGIIRISGENALDILNQVFVPFKENKIKINEDILKQNQKDIEVKVHLGQIIGCKISENNKI